MLFFTPLPPLSFHLAYCEGLPYSPLMLSALLSSFLSHCPLPLASLAASNTGGDACSPGMRFLHLERAGTEAGQPLHLISPRAEPGHAAGLQGLPKWACTMVWGPSTLYSYVPPILPSAHPLHPGICYPAHCFPPLLVRPAFFPGLLFYLVTAKTTFLFP